MSPPTVIDRVHSTIIFGFDSAWTDKNPGAICALSFDSRGRASFDPPRPVRFGGALQFIDENKRAFVRTVVAIDQPTIVPNTSGMRPVERVAASVVSYTGGGVQPANTGKSAMFGTDAPIRSFMKDLGADDDPELARTADFGSFLVEVFPALALSGLHDPFAGRRRAPKYNPKSSKFRLYDWNAVVDTAATVADGLGLTECSEWCSRMRAEAKPVKSDQDRLDSAICAVIGYIWLACKRADSILLGDLEAGYIVTPVSPELATRLKRAAAKKNVPCE